MYNIEGCKKLVLAVYKQAAKDYVEALVCGDPYAKRTIKQFLVSGAFGINPKIGERIVNSCTAETKAAKKFLDSFLDGDLKKIPVDPDISLNILRTVISTPYYRSLISLRLQHEKYYLIKKKKAIKNGVTVH